MKWLAFAFLLAYAEHQTASPPRAAAPGPAPFTPAALSRLVAQVREELGDFTAFTNCTSYSLRFHLLARERNLIVRTVGAGCPGRVTGHRFNMVQMVGGKWHFVEPQGNGEPQRPGFDDPESPSQEALCRMMEEDPAADGTCPCKVKMISKDPIPYNRNPIMRCALSPEFRNQSPSVWTFAACAACCEKKNAAHVEREGALTEEWAKACVDACRNHFLPRESP